MKNQIKSQDTIKGFQDYQELKSQLKSCVSYNQINRVQTFKELAI